MPGVVEGVLIYLGETAALVAVVGCILYADRVIAAATWAGRRLHVLRPPAPGSARMPIERVAGDLRRIGAEVRQRKVSCPVARYRGLIAAYDDALLDACRALEIPTTLGTVPEGFDHEIERMRIEVALEDAGVVLRRAS